MGRKTQGENNEEKGKHKQAENRKDGREGNRGKEDRENTDPIASVTGPCVKANQAVQNLETSPVNFLEK